MVFGDHGWNLGEHTLWCKHANFETATRTALMIKLPQGQNAQVSSALAGLIDIYPTLNDVCGLGLPNHVAGKSLLPVIKGQREAVNERVFSLYFDSYSMRTKRYRFTRYFEPTAIRNSTLADSTGIYELYDHQHDPDENFNIAYEPENRKLVQRLEKEMDEYGFLPL